MRKLQKTEIYKKNFFLILDSVSSVFIKLPSPAPIKHPLSCRKIMYFSNGCVVNRPETSGVERCLASGMSISGRLGSHWKLISSLHSGFGAFEPCQGL